MGSIVIFRISSCPPLFVVYQYHTCNWFYFSYFLLYINAFRIYVLDYFIYLFEISQCNIKLLGY